MCLIKKMYIHILALVDVQIHTPGSLLQQYAVVAQSVRQFVSHAKGWKFE